MSISEQIRKYMSLRTPQYEALCLLEEISATIDYKNSSLASVLNIANDKSKYAKPVEFDTQFPSFCFALATGVGKTRLMGAFIYYLWKQKGYRNYFIIAPNITIYEKLRSELNPNHPKYMFVGLDFPAPKIYDVDNYIRFRPEQKDIWNPANIFIFNIGKIFTPRTDTEFKFHRFNEYLGNSFSAILQNMDDLVVLMDESHRYRGEASLTAINHLKPVLGLEFTATPKYEKNVIYSFNLAQSIGKYVKTPYVVTRTNLTTSDAEEIEKLKLLDGMARHERKKGRLLEYCNTNNLPLVKPFVLISTKDTKDASRIRELLESRSFCDGIYKGKVIEIHSGKTGEESDENIQRLLLVEQPTNTVEIVIHVNMLKEGWDVKNLYTIIPLRASVSEILTEQTIGRGLRLPFGYLTGDEDLDSLEIISHDQYAKLIQAAKDSPIFKFKELPDKDFRSVKTIPVQHSYINLDKVLDTLSEQKNMIFTSELTDEKRLNEMLDFIVSKEAKNHETRMKSITTGGTESQVAAHPTLFPMPTDELEQKPFDPTTLRTELKTQLHNYALANIDVPDIRIETSTDKKLESFKIAVNIGPFELVEQHILTHDLSSGKEALGEKLEVMEIENPRAFLAGRLIDAIAELDVVNDKEIVLSIVDSYLSVINKPIEELKKIVHLYRDTIIKDMKNQIENNIQDNTQQKIYVKSSFIKFKSSSKTVFAEGGIVHYSKDVPKSDIQKYIFEGFKKTLYLRVSFDSTPEKDFASILEKDSESIKWIRPPEGNIPIIYKGKNYTPDFILETDKIKYMIEIKAQNELSPKIDEEVLQKAMAAIIWCKAASEIKGAKPWEYKLIPDSIIKTEYELKFILNQAMKL
ncbi:MAG: DEAD/DEAH box helicase family protein [bacterium]|nr:DEAD/DEAH box helicase family protein [bacterium]